MSINAAHNPEVVGPNPASATKKPGQKFKASGQFSFSGVRRSRSGPVGQEGPNWGESKPIRGICFRAAVGLSHIRVVVINVTSVIDEKRCPNYLSCESAFM